MSGLNEQIRIRAGYTRSVNLQRDVGNLKLVKAYLPTAKSLQALEQVVVSMGQEPAERALALVGPYGSGKSAFALFLSALLASADDPLHKAAINVLGQHDHTKALLPRFTQVTAGKRGFLRVVINGIPASLTKQLLVAFAHALEQQQVEAKLPQSPACRPSHDTVSNGSGHCPDRRNPVGMGCSRREWGVARN